MVRLREYFKGTDQADSLMNCVGGREKSSVTNKLSVVPVRGVGGRRCNEGELEKDN